MTDIQKIFNFATYLEGFKKLERFAGQVFWRDMPITRFESDADHTWRMAIILMSIESKLAKPLDFKKAMKMLLVHDIPELIAGDPSPLGTDGTGADSHAHNTVVAEEKFEREKRAAQEIFQKLPEDQAAELFALWLEFEEESSYEAQVVRAIDKLEGKLQAFEYTKGKMVSTHFDFTMKYGVHTFAVDPALKEFGDILLKELEEGNKK